MSKYMFGKKHWKNPDSKYSYVNENQLDVDILKNKERYNLTRQDVKKEILERFKSDPVRLEETFSMYIDVLRELKNEYNIR